MKVITTIAGLSPSSGGPSRTVPALCSALAWSGIEIDIMTQEIPVQEQNPLGPIIDQTPLKITFCGMSPKWPILNSIRFYNILSTRCKNQKIDLIHNHGIWLAVNHLATSVAKHYGIPLILSPRGMLSEWALRYKPWKKQLALYLFQRRDLKYVACFHATSELEAKDIRLLGIKQPIAIIPNGIEVPAWIEPANENRKMKTVLFLSRLNPTKGLINLVKAWVILKPENWKVIIAGPEEGRYRTEIQERIISNKLEDQFQFIGPLSDEEKWAVYRDADLFVLPSFSENFGVVIAEALACGVPVITTKGTPWKLLEEYACGWWIDIGVEPLVAALKEAVNLSDIERRVMGKNGRSLVDKKFKWDPIAAQMSEVYSWLVNGGVTPDCILKDI